MIETEVRSRVMRVYDILSKHTFEVPWHQRDYDWELEHVTELLDDLKDACDRESTSCFLGSIMLVERESEGCYEINDGQQRLVTLCLLVAALVRRFVHPDQADRAREARAVRLLFNRAENQNSTLEDSPSYDPRLIPPENDKYHFFQLIRGQAVEATESKLFLAWRTIDTFVTGMGAKREGEFFDFLHNQVELAVLCVPQNANANAVFESLNCRGKQLDDLDLMRNHLYSYFSDKNESPRRETVHQNLERARRTLGSKADEYFQCFFECEFGFIPQKRFYREAKTKLHIFFQSHGIGGLYELIQRLCADENFDLFQAINTKNRSEHLLANVSSPMGRNMRKLETLLRELQAYRVAHPLAFALLRRYAQEEEKQTKREAGKICAQSLSDLASFISRTVLAMPKFEPSRVESGLANCAREVSNGSELESLRIQVNLKDMDFLRIVKNEKFIENMTNISFSTAASAKARHYLFGIIEHNQPGAEALRNEKLTLEHILPKSSKHWEGWLDFPSGSQRDWIGRAGNCVLLTSGENRSSKEFNSSFSEKRKIYKNSTIQMTAEVGRNRRKWNPRAIQNRSKELAHQAVSVWEFSWGMNL